jgi:tRNA dimethylallyltransferase
MQQLSEIGLIVLCGPTASGKSGLALELARIWGAEILSADSRQVYRHFDIGTAKPTPAEQAQLPHHLIDICEPTETLTVGDWQQQAQTLIAGQQQRGQVPLLVGGTGLYIRAIARGMRFPRVPPSPELRAQLARLGQVHNHQMLRQLDPVAAARIHPNDAVRTERALEVFYVTGQRITDLQAEDPPIYRIVQIGLDCDRLDARIRRRADQMVEQGLVEEVSRLRSTYGPDLPLLQTMGYREIGQYLDGDLTLTEAITATALSTRQFAKRQRTWFRAVPEIRWFDSEAPDLRQQVLDWVTAQSR